MYVCGKCGRTIKSLDEHFVRCPYCGHRIIYKVRAPVAREISTD
ncbi:DNA-directed RNA polymerase subunit P [Candidatus Micrarchaeota archaeon]|nr:DNA-directed RNA polymerase subunit P [Candidatus Micrarchaeota archaeon]